MSELALSALGFSSVKLGYTGETFSTSFQLIREVSFVLVRVIYFKYAKFSCSVQVT